MSASTLKPTFLLDTNVWLAFNLGKRDSSAEARQFISLANQRELPLITPMTSLKDFYYVFCLEMKRCARAEGAQIDAACASSINELAWAVTRNILELSQVVPMGPGDSWGAFMFKHEHTDFEDDLLLACADRCRVDYIVTEDERLSQHAPFACVSIAEALQIVQGLSLTTPA